MDANPGPVVGVVGGSGGVGASTFAAVIARVAAAAVALVDVDVAGGGIDVLLGVEHVPGARWSGIRLGGGVLDPAVLLDGLPRWDRVAVLALDDAPPPAASVAQVVDAAAALATVVVDLGRAVTPQRATALRRCDLVVVLARADVRELAATRAVVVGLDHRRVGLVLRRGSVAPAEAAAVTGVPLLGALGPGGAVRRAVSGRVPGRWARVAAGVLDAVGAIGVGPTVGSAADAGADPSPGAGAGSSPAGVTVGGAPCPT